MLQIKTLLTAGGFEIKSLETVHFSSARVGNPLAALLMRPFLGKMSMRREFIVAMASKDGEVRDRYPVQNRLYRQPLRPVREQAKD